MLVGELRVDEDVSSDPLWSFCKLQSVDVNHLTAPNNAPSHSVRSTSTVRSGRAVPVFSNVSNPAERSTKEKLSFNEAGRASRMRLPA